MLREYQKALEGAVGVSVSETERYDKKRIEVLGKTMAYVEVGKDDVRQASPAADE